MRISSVIFKTSLIKNCIDKRNVFLETTKKNKNTTKAIQTSLKRMPFYISWKILENNFKFENFIVSLKMSN